MRTPAQAASSRVVNGPGGQGGQQGEQRGGIGDLDALQDLSQAALAGIARAPAPADRRRGANVILGHEHDLDGQMRVAEQRGEGDEPIEQLQGVAAAGRGPGGEHEAVGVDANDPTLRGDRVDDPEAVLIQERVELGRQRAKATRLHLDQLAVGAHEVDDVAPDLDLEAIPGARQGALEGGVQRTFAQHPDPVRHLPEANERRGDGRDVVRRPA